MFIKLCAREGISTQTAVHQTCFYDTVLNSALNFYDGTDKDVQDVEESRL